MPGIVGIITKRPRAWAEAQLHRMVNALCHEASYVSGVWSDESLGIYAGWIARENSFSSEMPLQSESGDQVLIFSGEEYPDPQTVAGLVARGHEIEDTESAYLGHMAE